MSTSGIRMRPAQADDVARIEALQHASLRGLATRYYPADAIESAIAHGSFDRELLDSGALYLAEVEGQLAACGGWHREEIAPVSLDSLYADCGLAPPPTQSSAKIRSVFVHPDWAGRGVARHLMRHLEAEAEAAGYRCFELLSSLSGAAFYQRLGYRARAMLTMPVGEGVALSMIHMDKEAAANGPLASGCARAA